MINYTFIQSSGRLISVNWLALNKIFVICGWVLGSEIPNATHDCKACNMKYGMSTRIKF